jgi:hypothetical protein
MRIHRGEALLMDGDLFGVQACCIWSLSDVQTGLSKFNPGIDESAFASAFSVNHR